MDPSFPFDSDINPEYSTPPPTQNESQTFPQHFPYNQHFNPYFNPQSQPFSHLPFNPYMFAGPSQIPSQQQSQSTSKSGKKKIQGRNPNWNMAEDEALCKAWLSISEVAEVGTDQQRGKLLERIRVEFIKNLNKDSGRNISGLMNRWATIQYGISKFSSYVRFIDISQPSGYNAEDSMAAVKLLYNNKEHHQFKWESCWNILKDTPKWYDHTIAQKTKQKNSSKKRGPKLIWMMKKLEIRQMDKLRQLINRPQLQLQLQLAKIMSRYLTRTQLDYDVRLVAKLHKILEGRKISLPSIYLWKSFLI